MRNAPRSGSEGRLRSRSGACALGGNRLWLGCDEGYRDLLPLPDPEDDLERKGAEDHEGCDTQTDRRVEGVGSDRPPTVGVQQEPAKRLALEEGGHLAGDLRVSRVSLRLRAHLRIGQSTG